MATRRTKRDPEETRQSAAALITVLLNDRLQRLASGEYTDAFDRHYRELCRALLSKHSEAYGKLLGCEKWSVAAVESFKRHKDVVTSVREDRTDALRHEHVFPRKQLIELLFELELPKLKTVEMKLEKLNLGAVVTHKEHGQLPSGGNEVDPWQRYKEGKVQLAEEVPPCE